MHHLPLAMDNLILNFLHWFYTNHALNAAFTSKIGRMKIGNIVKNFFF